MRALLLWLLVAVSFPLPAQPSRAEEAKRAAVATAWLKDHLNVREATGNNDGPEVWAIIHAGGGKPNAPWCGYTQRQVQAVLHLPYPANPGLAANWFLDPKRTYYQQGRRGVVDSIRVGHCVGIYSRARGQVGHITRAIELVPPLRKGRAPRGAYCGGGNEGIGKNAGIHRNLYPLSSIYALSNWLY